jgi:hypothetical protein
MARTAAPVREAALSGGATRPVGGTTRDAAHARDLALLAGPALLAAGLCLIGITGRSLGFDESATVAIAGQHGSALWSAIAHDGGNMSGYYVLMHVLISLLGKGLLVLRLPSAIGAGAAVGLLEALALQLFDRRVAVAAGVLSAVSLPLVFWGQSARSYALLVALVTGSFLAYASMLDGRRPRAAAIGYVLCTALAMYASLMAILIVPAQLVLLAWHRGRARAVGSALGAVVVLCVPLMVLVAERGSGQLFWVPRPDSTAIKQVLQALTSAGLEPSFHATSTTTALLVCTVAALAVAAVALVAAGARPLLAAGAGSDRLRRVAGGAIDLSAAQPADVHPAGFAAVGLGHHAARRASIARLGGARRSAGAAGASGRAQLRPLSGELARRDRLRLRAHHSPGLCRVLSLRWPQCLSLLRPSRGAGAPPGAARRAVRQPARVYRGLCDPAPGAAATPAPEVPAAVAGIEPRGPAERHRRLARQLLALPRAAELAVGRVPAPPPEVVRLRSSGDGGAVHALAASAPAQGRSVVPTNVSALSPASRTPLAAAYATNPRRLR